MEIINLLFFVFILVAPIAVGTAMMLFSKRLTVRSLQFRQAALKIGFSDTEVKVGQVLAVGIGGFLLISGLVSGFQRLFP